MGLRAASLFLLWLALSYANEIRKGRTRNHGHYVCSTWGNNHFKTFDGDIYQFPGMCEYNFASDCRESYKEFSVHIQRARNSNNHPEIQYILITIKDFTVYLRPKLAVVDGRIVKTPYYSSGMFIESNDIYTKVYAKLGLILIWNQEDALMVELDSRFSNHTCGLCGDYNGVPIYNEFINGDANYNSITYGNLQKIRKPNAKCEDPDETQALPSCNEHRHECERLLTSSAFADCRLRLNLEMYIQACMQDKCACNGNEDSFCLCSTISEYSRQCSHAGGRPGEWRTEYFCPKTCPDTMIYRESSSPCMDTCSHLGISSLCEEHYMDGCFCPEGTVYDDITEKGCIPASQCRCKLHGKEYSPGESITNECEECVCDSGRWTCKDLPCPGTCSVEGGSHITTFDGKKYTFHGDCYYVLAKGTVNDSYALLAELTPCGSTDRQTCLKTVVLLVDDKKNVVAFRSDGSVLLNEMAVNVPHVSASFSVFKPSSYYLIVQTSFGLQLQIQLFPVMQLFATVDQSVQGKLQGLCGNFNGMEGDDFKTASGLVEATGSAFANTWKAQSTCNDQVEKLEDPCSLSIESANYAEHWCSLLKNSEGPFARCHLVIDPSEYYKKCKYDTCLCEDNEECLCAALSSYSRACAFKGIILEGWRKSVCSNEVSTCPGNQIFLYNLTMCQQTCRSLIDGEKHCLQDFTPVDGCGCPYNTYLDNQGTCVPISKCPCYYKGSYLEPGEYVTKDGERCVCRNAKVQCTSVTIRTKGATECSSNKTYFDCNASPKWSSQTPIQLSCHTPQTDYFQAECVSGCVCPEGLFDDGKGGCVEAKDCPCFHNNQWYSSGQKITVDCNTCTCQKGFWSCTEHVCYGTCMIYGSGHYITFDGKFYDFDGSCEYVATQDFCGDKNSSGSFSIITENVPCGTTGVTCSKAIKMFLGKTELKLENKDYKEIQRDTGDDVRYWNKTVGFYLVIEASNGVMLIWDKKTTVFIKLTPDYKGKVCGLCGNFDDKSNNDFTTRSGLQETNALKFGNSWKQSSMCPDVTQEIKPCDVKPHRKSWAEKECSIIQSEVFKICHSKVDPVPFYEACVHDACSCDSGGDCECFCSAVAAYAQECTKAQACVFWRTPDICPIFCDYYNPRNECDWHYEPCGSNVTTCRMINNVSTNFSVPYLEGCYPRCPEDKPVYNEETKECVTEDKCWCYINGTPVLPGQEIPTEDNCTICVCGPSGSIQCKPVPGCPCVINGTSYEVGETVAQIQDGNICTTYICAENGSVVVGSIYPCPTSTSPTTISTSFPTSTLTTTVTTTSPPASTTPCFVLICNWTEWFDVSKPEEDGGDYETYDAIRNEHGNKICEAPEDIECRAKDNPDMSLEELGQKVECNVTYGLICRNEEQDATIWQLCYNYEIRVNCCEWHEISCEVTPTPTPTGTSITTSTTVPTITTARQPTAITTTPVPTPTITSEAPPSSTRSTMSPPPLSTTTPTPTSSEPPSSTATTTMPPSSTSGSTPGTTLTVPTTSTPIPMTASTSVPTPTYTATQSPPDCTCIWTGWIDVSYPDSSDRNSGDYETFENILKHNSSFVCAKAENISCRATRFPDIPITDLGQNVECSVDTGLVCNNSDQTIGGIIPMPVCLNYEINICCIPNIPECVTSTTVSTTVSTTTAPPSSTRSTMSPPPLSTTASTPTSSEPPSSTATTTMPPSSTSGSTPGTTLTVPTTSTPIPMTASTSVPTPTYTATQSPPDCTCIWTGWIDVSYPDSSDRNSGDYETFENILKHNSSFVCAKAENISCRATRFPDIPITDLGQNVECSVDTGLVCNNSDQTIGGIIPMPVCLNYEINICCIPNIPECVTSTTVSTTVSTTTAPPSSTRSTMSPPPLSTTASTPTSSEPPSSTATTTMPPSSTSGSTPGTTLTVPTTLTTTPMTASTFTPPIIITRTPLAPTSEAIKHTTSESGTLTNTTTAVTPSVTAPPTAMTEIASTVSTISTTIEQSTTLVSTTPVTVTTSGVTETWSTTRITPSGPTPSGPPLESTTILTERPTQETTTTGTGSPPTAPPTATASTTTTAPPSPGPTASTTVWPPSVSTTPVTVTTSGVTETGSTTRITPSGPTPSGPPLESTTILTERPTQETTTTGTGSPPTAPPTATASTTTTAPPSPGPTASTTVLPPSVSTTPVTVTTSGVTETGSTTRITPSGPTPSGPPLESTTILTERPTQETTTTGTGSPPTAPPTATASTTTTAPPSPGPTASTTVLPPSVSTTPVTVTTSGVTETGSTTRVTPSGPTPSGPPLESTTILTERPTQETTTTGTGSPPTAPPTATASTTTTAPPSPGPTASTTVLPPSVSTTPVTVTTSGVTETGSTTRITPSGPTPSGPPLESTTILTERPTQETTTTGTGSPPTAPPTATASTTTTAPPSPGPTASTTVLPPLVSTTPVTVTTSGVTETGSTTRITPSGPTPSGPPLESTTILTERPTQETTTTGTGSPPTAPPTATASTTTTAPPSPGPTASTTVLPPLVSTTPVTATTSGVTETGSTTRITPSGPTPSGPPLESTTILTERPTQETTTTGTGSPPTAPPTATASTTTTAPPSPGPTASTTVLPPSVSTTPVTVTTSGVTETGSTTRITPSGPTPSGPPLESTTILTERPTQETTTTGTGSPPTAPPTATASITTSGPFSQEPITGTTVLPPSVSTTPVTVTTSGVTETGSTTRITPSGPTPSGPPLESTTILTERPTQETTTTGTGSPPTAPPTATASTTTTAPPSPGPTASTTVLPPSVSTTPVTVTTSGVTETGSTTRITPSGPTPSGPPLESTTILTERPTQETTTTGTGSPPTAPPTATASTTTTAPPSPGPTASTTVLPPSVSTTPVTVTTSGVTETGSTTRITPSGPTPSGPPLESTTILTERPTQETTTTGTGSPPTAPPTATASTTTTAPPSPGPTASTTVLPPSVSTTPVTVTTSGVTETGSTTRVTPSGPTPSGPPLESTTILTERPTQETTTTGTGSPPTAPPTATASTTTTAPPSPGPTASTTVLPPSVSTTPVTVTTSGVTETGSTTRVTPSGPTPSGPPLESTTILTERPTQETTTTGTGSPPTAPPTATASTTTTAPPSPGPTASTTVWPPSVSTTPVTVTTSGVTETGSTTRITPSGPTPSGPPLESTTILTERPTQETTTTGTGSPPTAPPTATASTTTTAPPSPGPTASTTVLPPSVSTTPVTATTSGVTETGSTTRITPSGPTPSGPPLESTTILTERPTQETTTTGTGSPPTAPPTATASITTSGPFSQEPITGTTVLPPSVSTTPVSVTTSGTTPTESFTTTSGTTSSSFTSIAGTTTTTATEIVSPGSTSTSWPTETSSAVTIAGSSTYSTVTPASASSSATSLPSATPGRNCSIFPNESYAPGESWWLCECIKAICIEDDIVQVVPIICEPPPKPTCANGLSPVQVLDKDGCCWHWECDCYCTGWGDPHYMTFDGLYYSYQGNCTYVLVEEISKKVDNFGVYIDNYHCDTRDVVSCPRTLIVRHETQEVRIATVKPNTLQVEVTVNKQVVSLPYKKFGLSIYESGINRVVEIPELKMNVTYNGLSFSIRMPYSLFGNNTQGQCGTCNNNTADDCMLPNGNVAENCETMADHWQVVDPSKPQCSPGLSPTKVPGTAPVQPCKESSICELLLGSVFEPCHGFVQPEKYYAACVFDSCVLPNLDLECSSLQTYAAVCADQSVCIDWRNHTNGVCCSYKCPSGKEYRACGPIKEITCKSSQQNETSSKRVEGCFCPNGTMLYDSGVDVCVKTCGCVGVDKIPREFGERFTVDCQDCICLEGENGIVCEPHECAKQNKTSCDGEGFYEVNEVNSEDSCCPIVTCKCNTSLCTSKAPKCTLGFEVHSHIPSGQCCPVYQCVPKRVCVHQNAEFLPNSSVFVDKCQNCLCTDKVNVSNQLNIISCEHIPCNTYCEPGYELQPVKGECCGRCVQTKCVIHTGNNFDLVLSPGEFKSDPYNNCTIYSCVNVHNQLISSTSEITCPAFSEKSCKPGTITFLPNGCCKTCAPLDSPAPCAVHQRKDFILYKGCRSVNRVVMTECEGTCGTFSLYSAEANSMDHSCSCCKESRTSVREVELKCPTGHSISHKYIYVESCSCQETECSSSQSSESQSTEENDKASTLNRIKRAISLTSK
ncbi:mucin-2 [Falco biarmicus]|uniref:mucin-2 n=1 Tax=Falco biarmicus TaxID=345155 RepID=UPI0024BC5FD7|nr:mucin-2 [Falco biarmicus]